MKKLVRIVVATILTASVAIAATGDDHTRADQYRKVLNILSKDDVSAAEAKWVLDTICGVNAELLRLWEVFQSQYPADTLSESIEPIVEDIADEPTEEYASFQRTVASQAGIDDDEYVQESIEWDTNVSRMMIRVGVERFLIHVYETLPDTIAVTNVMVCCPDKAVDEIGLLDRIKHSRSLRLLLGIARKLPIKISIDFPDFSDDFPTFASLLSFERTRAVNRGLLTPAAPYFPNG